MADAAEDVDHTVTGYLVDYATCLLLICAGAWLLRRHGVVLAWKEAMVQFLMANGYLMGSLGHHLFANRAQTDACANVWYYLVWAISYPSMSASNLLWLQLARSDARAARPGSSQAWPLATALTALSHAVADACIVFGGAWCFATVPHYPGVADDCPAGPGLSPACDASVWWGEAIYFAAWFAASALTAICAKGACAGSRGSAAERRLNIAQSLLLVFGPVQILLVYDLLPGGGAELSARIGTAVTYKTAVCLNQLTILWLSDARLTATSGGGAIADKKAP